jgi:replicative DNA helicase
MRIPPHNMDAERAVLGAILLEGRETLPRVIELLKPSDFYTEAHRVTYQGMLSLFNRSEPVDVLTLTEELRRADQLQLVGGPAALALLVEQGSISAYLNSYASIVRDMAVLRELIQTSSHIIAEAFEAKEDVQTLVDDAERRIFSLAERRLEGSALPIGKILRNTFEYIERLYERKEHVTGVATGFEKLDLETSGFQPSDFIIIAGRPSMGKTAFALNVAQHVGIALHGKVLVLSLEMSSQQIVQRMLCAEAKVDSQAVRTGYLTSSDWHRLTAAAGRLSEASIFIDDSPGLTVLEARAKARRMKAEHGLDLLVIDYLQLMRGRAAMESRQQEISEISRSLKALAKELNVPVVALSQLSRAVEARQAREFKPQLSDLRECVTGDTLVLLSDGRRVPIRDLVEAAPEVLAISAAGKIVKAKTERIWAVGTRPVFSARLACGRTIRATAEHRLLSGRGWVTVAELGVGDRLAIARTLPEPIAPDRWPDQRVALLGQLIGDGSYLSHQPLRYTTSSDENSEIVARAAREEFGCRVTRYARRGSWHQLLLSGNGNRWHHSGVGGWLRDLGIFGQRSHEKRLPETAFLLSTEQVVATSDLFWDRIVNIAPAGEEAVYDLTVPGPASWLADGIVSHNSGALEQDADVILFLYRQSQYKEDLPPDEKNIAEVIIGKQRNGPVGTVKVVFLPQYARFENVADQHRQPQPF